MIPTGVKWRKRVSRHNVGNDGNMMKKIKKNQRAICFFLAVLCIVSFIWPQTVEAKKRSYITNEAFVGTYGYKGNEGSFETGWYYIIINKISDSGKVRFALDLGGTNASPLYETGPLTATIKGKKAKFTYENDGWGNKGKGTIVFKKNGDLYLTVKETYTSEVNRASLATGKVVFKKVSEEHKIYTNS